MTQTDTLTLPSTGLLARWTPLHTAWLLFAPPAVAVGLRWVLQLQVDRLSTEPALPLAPVTAPTGMMDLLWPVVVVLAVLGLVGWLKRRLGWARIMPAVGLLWVLLWLGGSAALLRAHLNDEGLFLHDITAPRAVPGPTFVNAHVLVSQFKQPSLRSEGGVELVLQVPGLSLPHRLLISDPEAMQIKPGDTLALAFSPGRFSGLFVTDWQVTVPAAPVHTSSKP